MVEGVQFRTRIIDFVMMVQSQNWGGGEEKRARRTSGRLAAIGTDGVSQVGVKIKDTFSVLIQNSTRWGFTCAPPNIRIENMD